MTLYETLFCPCINEKTAISEPLSLQDSFTFVHSLGKELIIICENLSSFTYDSLPVSTEAAPSSYGSRSIPQTVGPAHEWLENRWGFYAGIR
jgi:hypothetical protein